MKKRIKICIVCSKYNDTSKLLKSATKELIKKKISFSILEVPGAFEIPVVISRNINKYDGFIAVGSIIKGKTPNFNFVNNNKDIDEIVIGVQNNKELKEILNIELKRKILMSKELLNPSLKLIDPTKL